MASFGWDAPKVYNTSVYPSESSVDSRANIEKQFFEFLRSFRIDHSFIYRYIRCINESEQLRLNILQKQYFLEINLSHLESFDAELKAKVKSSPATYLPIVIYTY